jgi:hypothetical protein
MESKKPDDEVGEDRRVPRVAAGIRPMMLWVVYPGDPQEPPFHFSNTPGVMLIAAPDAGYARRLAANEAGDVTWLDKDRVHVDEYKPAAAMVLSRDFRK